MKEDVQIRPAQPDDADVAAVLLVSAYTHMQMTYPSSTGNEHGFIEHLRRFFRKDGNRFSYQHCYVAEHNALVVGLILSFGGRDEEQLNSAIAGWLEREAEADEWYVDAVAVLSNWGHKGIGTRLLKIAELQARQRDYTKMALNVAQDNKGALSLYQSLHYIITSETVLYQRPYVRMVKVLDKEEEICSQK